MPSSSTREALEAILAASGQTHVLEHWDTLTEAERAELAAEVQHVESTVGFTHLNDVLEHSLSLLRGAAAAGTPDADSAAAQPSFEAPPEHLVLEPATLEKAKRERLWEAGLKAVAAGQVAVLVLAGGSGTRLGVQIPKGLFVPDELAGDRSLFQIHCEKVLRVQHLAAQVSQAADSSQPTIQVLIMTSDQNDAETQAFFRQRAYFGLKPSQVHFFRQSSLPCYRESDRKILMASPGHMCLAPGGNGGVWRSVATAPLTSAGTEEERRVAAQGDAADNTTTGGNAYANALDLLQSKGVRYVHIAGVDNILSRMADPLFTGYAIDTEAEVAVKSVPRKGPDERVGVFVRRYPDPSSAPVWGVQEYTELAPAQAAAVSPETGRLVFNCANIAYHCCTTEFLVFAAEKMLSETLYHAAIKAVPTVSGSEMGVKMEAFIFDMFAHAGAVATRRRGPEAAAQDECGGFRIMQVAVSEEFGPIKNATDKAATDNPHTAARMVRELGTRWVRQALLSRAAAAAEGRSAAGGHSEGSGEAAGESETPDEIVALYNRAAAILEAHPALVQVSPLVSFAGEGLEPHLTATAREVLAWSANGEPDTIIHVQQTAHTTSKV